MFFELVNNFDSPNNQANSWNIRFLLLVKHARQSPSIKVKPNTIQKQNTKQL